MTKDKIIHHARVFALGFARMVFGTLTAGLLGLAAYGFVSIPSEGGYIAVADFIASICTLAVVLVSIYAMGCKGKKRRFSA